MPLVLLAIVDTLLAVVALLALLAGGVWLAIAAWALLAVEVLSVAGLARLARHTARKDRDV